MLLEDSKRTIANLMQQTTHLVCLMIVVNSRRAFVSEQLSAHRASVVLLSEKSLKILLAHVVPKVAMLRRWIRWWRS